MIRLRKGGGNGLPHLIFALVCVAAGAQTPRFFIQGSDPQFGMYAKDANFTQETANFEFFIANANRLKPLFVVVCGDLTNRAGDADQISEYKRIGRKLDPAIKLYSVPGNHDTGNDPTPESLSAYRRNYGPDYYAFRAGDFLGIVLNSNLIKSPVNVQSDAGKQETWLRGELAKAKGSGARQIAIFQHHPWFLESASEPEQYFNLPRIARDRYLALFREYGVHYAFAGHYHRNAYGKDGDLEMITTGAVGMPIGPDPSGFRIVTIGDGKLEQRYYGFGVIPNRQAEPPAAPR